MGIAVVPSTVRAAPPTKQACIAADDAAQALRRSARLREARDQLALCVSPDCPQLVREDCAERLAEVDRAMPRVRIEVSDDAGRDVGPIRVSVDGRRVASLESGQPAPLDPGQHRVVVEVGPSRAEQTIVVREGHADQLEHIVLPALPALSPLVPAQSHPQGTVALVLGVAGGVGLAVGTVLAFVAKLTYDQALRSECDGHPTTCSAQGIQDDRSAHNQAAGATAAFVVGGALLATGAVLYLTTPVATLRIGATARPDLAGLTLGGSWR
jgi:hypothetical protein